MTTICGYVVHEVAEFFPMMNDAEFAGLVDDIAANGLLEPIVLDVDGLLIDGRNRAKACEELALTPTTKTHDGDVVSFVTSHNIHRRNLNESQRAMIAAKLAQRASGQRAPHGEGASIEAPSLPPTQVDLAEQLNVSRPSVQRAKRVIKSGTDDLRAAVEEGAVTVSRAATIVDLPDEQQDEFVAKVRAGVRPSEATPPKQPPVKQPPRMGGNRRKHAQILDAFVAQLAGSAVALDEIANVGLDASVTKEEAARIRGDLSSSVRSVNRVIQLLKEFTS